MGEYCTAGKMGTCEDMYYLRPFQRFQVTPERGSLNPADSEIVKILRFRFPFPDEDHCLPCAFDKFDRSVAFSTVTPVVGDHGTKQWQASGGYLVSLPCPETVTEYNGSRIHRNGYPGGVHLAQVGYREPRGWVPILRCNGCGHMAQATPEQIIAMIDELRTIAASRERAETVRWDHPLTPESIAQAGHWHRELADRLLTLDRWCEEPVPEKAGV